MRKYTPRRAGKRWLESAPEFILDCFRDTRETLDQYSILFGGSMIEGDGTFGGTHIQGWSEFGSFELQAHQAVDFRYRQKRYRVRWADLPAHIRKAVVRWATQD